VLAHDAQQYAALVSDADHLLGGLQIHRDGFLHLNVLPVRGADLQRLEPKIRKCADVDIVDVRVYAQFFVCRNELATVLLGEFLSVFRVNVRADGYFKTDVPVDLRMLVGNGSRSDESDFHTIMNLT
jgi:hypothetical protein